MARIVKLKQKIIGGRKIGQEPTSIKDPETGDLLVSSNDIKTTTLKYCVKNLADNQVKDSVKSIVMLKQMLHEMRINENTTDEFEVEIEEYEEVLQKVQRKKYQLSNQGRGQISRSHGILCSENDKGRDIPRRLQEDSPPNDLERERACRSTLK